MTRWPGNQRTSSKQSRRDQSRLSVIDPSLIDRGWSDNCLRKAGQEAGKRDGRRESGTEKCGGGGKRDGKERGLTAGGKGGSGYDIDKMGSFWIMLR